MIGCRRLLWLFVFVSVAITSTGCGLLRRKEEPPQPPEPPEARDTGIRRQPIRTPLACVKEGHVWLMDGDGNEQRRVDAPGNAIPESLQWSPDASRIAFWTIDEGRAGRGGPFRLCAADGLDVGPAEVLHTTEPGLGGDRPFFSRGGKVLCASVFGGTDAAGARVGGLFAERFTRNQGTLRFHFGGGEPDRLLPERPAARGPLRWAELAPDGGTLVAVSGNDVDGGHLTLIDFATGETTEARTRTALYASWSPKQRRLAYLRPADGGTCELRVWVPGEDTSTKVIADLSPEATFAWAPDGHAIAYANADIYAVVVENAGGKWTELRSQSQEGSIHRYPTWAPNQLAVVLERLPSGQPQRVLQRDSFDPSVAGKEFFPGGRRPLFAPS
jgi:hypothetical protein